MPGHITVCKLPKFTVWDSPKHLGGGGGGKTARDEFRESPVGFLKPSERASAVDRPSYSPISVYCLRGECWGGGGCVRSYVSGRLWELPNFMCGYC